MSEPHAIPLKFLSLINQAVARCHNNPRLLRSSTLASNSLNLMDKLPAARSIVFKYFALVADLAVESYAASTIVHPKTGLLSKSEGRADAPTTEDRTFVIIEKALGSLINEGPPAWSAFVAMWSLDKVAALSGKYTKKNMSIGVASNFWLHNATMRGLLALMSHSYRKLSNVEADALLEKLIAAHQQYPATFDWAVVGFGVDFPLKITSQILQWSFSRFAENMFSGFDSEVRILKQLSLKHEQELKTTMREMLQKGLAPKTNLSDSIVPFLVVFSDHSEVLMQILVDVFLEMYNDDVRLTILQRYPLWLTIKAFTDLLPSFRNLALRLKSQGTVILIGMAQMAQQFIWCNDFLEDSMQQLEKADLNVHNCPLMQDLITEESKCLLWKSCLSGCLYEQQTAVRLLLIVSTQHSQIYYQTLSELLKKSYITNPNGIGAVVRMMRGQVGSFPDVEPGLRMVLEDVLLHEQVQTYRHEAKGGTSEAHNTFSNLIALTRKMKKRQFVCIKPDLLISKLNDCLSKIMEILEVTVTKLVLHIDREGACGPLVSPSDGLMDVACGSKAAKTNRTATGGLPEEAASKEHAERLVLAHAVVELLNAIDAGDKSKMLQTSEVLKLAVLSVKYFFISLTEKTAEDRCAAVNRALVLLRRQCSAQKAARYVCLRELVEGALFHYGFLFGHYEDPVDDALEIPEEEFVYTQNLQHSFGPNSNRMRLHVGVIGQGLRPEASTAGVGCDADIQTLFLKALDSCCADVDKQNDIEGYSIISRLLVEMVSPSVMHNDLPFLDYGATMETDLLIRRAFLTSPILWALLGAISTHRPALCHSSVLLRALCATCLHQWRAKNVSELQPINKNDELMQCTKKLLEILAVGQLLLPPLSNLHMIIEHFEPPDIALLLKKCVWNYLEKHAPSPDLFQVDINGLYWRNAGSAKIPAQYVDPLRILMQKKLAKLGKYYYQMFVMPETNASSDAVCTEMPKV